MTASPLPADVLEALRQGRKIEAIRLLRAAWGLGLKEAKDAIDACEAGDIERLVEIQAVAEMRGESPADTQPTRTKHRPAANPGLVHERPGMLATLRSMWRPLLVLAAFGWALVGSVIFVSALIVLLNRDGYVREDFLVDKLQHTDNQRSGLIWGFTGSVAGKPERFYAPTLADGRTLSYLQLRSKFPPGSRLQVWYNPAVTDTLFQKRSLRVLPYNSDLSEPEIGRVIWWLSRCLLPLVLVLLWMRHDERKGKTERH